VASFLDSGREGREQILTLDAWLGRPQGGERRAAGNEGRKFPEKELYGYMPAFPQTTF
jgi:hypothetical protein